MFAVGAEGGVGVVPVAGGDAGDGEDILLVEEEVGVAVLFDGEDEPFTLWVGLGGLGVSMISTMGRSWVATGSVVLVGWLQLVSSRVRASKRVTTGFARLGGKCRGMDEVC